MKKLYQHRGAICSHNAKKMSSNAMATTVSKMDVAKIPTISCWGVSSTNTAPHMRVMESNVVITASTGVHGLHRQGRKP